MEEIDQINKELFIKLEVGHEFGSYPKMCAELGIKAKGGDSRRAQKKEIDRYIKLSKGKGYRLIVDEIYDVPKPKEGNNVYGGLVQLLLTDYFMKENKKSVIVSSNYLLQKVKMINENYSDNRNNVPKYAEQNYIDEDIAFDFYDTTGATFSNVIKTALNHLENQALILHTTTYIVQPTDQNSHRKATRNERSVILSTRDKLLKKFGHKSIQSILHSPERSKYLNESREILQKKIKVDYCYKGYDIDIQQESIAEKQERNILSYLSDAQKEGYEDELNQLVINRLLKNAENRQRKAKEGFGSKSKKQTVRQSNAYIKSIEIIIDDNIVPSNQLLAHSKKADLKLEKEINDAMDYMFSD